jgi:hypothetical protein
MGSCDIILSTVTGLLAARPNNRSTYVWERKHI